MSITTWVDARLDRMTDRIVDRVVEAVVRELSQEAQQFVVKASGEVAETVTSSILGGLRAILGPFKGLIR